MLTEKMQDHLRQTVLKGKGLPGSFFTSPEMFEIEMKKIFSETWISVAFSDELATPGTVVPVSAASTPVLLTRDNSGKLRAFYNICSHRGTVLVTGACEVTSVACPYHCWSYGLDGTLLHTPHVGGDGKHSAPEIDKSQLGLTPVSVAEWGGVVFVNLSKQPQPFQDFIKPVADRWSQYDMKLLRRDASLSATVDVRTNWKIAVENYVESYHVPWVHKGLQKFNPMSDHFQILGGTSYLGQGGKNYKPADDGVGTLPSFPGAPSSRYEALYIYPNTIYMIFNDTAWVMILTPVSPDESRERIEFLFVGDESLAPQLAAKRKLIAQRFIDVNLEDIGIIESIQAGRKSPAFRGGQFVAAQEATSLHFQKMVAGHLLGAPTFAPESLIYDEIHHH